jgi:predicted CXXCH cytochrome family protein
MDPLLSKPGKSVLSNAPASVARATKYPLGALIFSLSLLLLLPATRASAVEHPGILHKDDNCSSCHPDKTSGKSVHSAMALSCTVCHLAETQGDMTTLNLAMPRQQICFACHEKFMSLQHHSPGVKGICVDCHDAHSSNRRLLLRKAVDTGRREKTKRLHQLSRTAINEMVSEVSDSQPRLARTAAPLRSP